LPDNALSERIRVPFISGGDGLMPREERVMHVVNHATYHGGMVAEMPMKCRCRLPSRT